MPGVNFQILQAMASSASYPSISYIGNNSNTASATSHTFTAQSIGATGNNRVIIVAISCSAASGSLSSATIGGVGATINVQANGTSTLAAIISASVPTGTTADIVLNWSASELNVAIAVYRVVDLSSTTAAATGTDTALSSGVASLTLNNNANAIMVASAVGIDGSSWASWSTGLTEDSDQFIASNNAAAASSGFFASANTPYTASATCGGTRGVMVAATWNN